MNACRFLMLAFVAGLVALGVSCGSGSSNTDDAPAADVDLDAGSVYIALGDSLSAGFGASSVDQTSFVPLVHQSLDDGYQLVNLGVGGATSQDLIDRQLAEAVTMIEDANGDDDPANDVSLVTLEIGGNDLLALYFSAVLTGVCPDIDTALAKPDCYEPLTDILATFDQNFAETLDALLHADPLLRLVVMTLYDPFSGFLPAQSGIAVLALEGMPGTRFEEGLNDIIRRHADERNLPVAELFGPFEGRAQELISGDFIHPNDTGYRVMADAVIELLD